MTGRNDPCPCGSGKKYKKCCLDKQTFMESQGTPNAATEVLHQLQSQIGDKPLSSMEELNTFTAQFMEQQNQAPIEDFMGLSSAQMRHLLHGELFSTGNILSLRDEEQLDSSLLLRVPAIKQTLYLLEELGRKEKGVKATQTGNLPRILVQNFHSTFKEDLDHFRGKPMSQIDVWVLDRLVFALKELRLIKMRTGWISLTKKGREMGVLKNHYTLYRSLFSFYGDSLDWLSITYYDDGFAIIQRALSFNLYILKKIAREYTSQRNIVQLFRNAFPQVGELTRPFVFLFLDDFCRYFGLVEREGNRSFADYSKELAYRQSDLFAQLFEWNV